MRANEPEIALVDVSSHPDRHGEREGEDGFSRLDDRAALTGAGEDDSIGWGHEAGIGEPLLDWMSMASCWPSARATSMSSCRGPISAKSTCGPRSRRLPRRPERACRGGGCRLLPLADSAAGARALYRVLAFTRATVASRCELCPGLCDLLRSRAVREPQEISGRVVAPGSGQAQLVREIAIVERGDLLTGRHGVAFIDGQGLDPPIDFEREVDLADVDVSLKNELCVHGLFG